MFGKRFFIVVGLIIISAFIAQLLAAPRVKDFIISKTREALGVDISIGNCAINLLGGRITLEDVSVPNPQVEGECLIKAKEMSVELSLIPFLLKKEAPQTISLIRPELILHRDTTGTLVTPQFKKPEGAKEPDALAAVRQARYEIFISRVLVKDGSLKLVDHFVATPPTIITFSNVNSDIVNSLSLAERKIITQLEADGRIDEEGTFAIKGKGDFVSEPVSFDGVIKVEGVSLPKLTPYYGENLSIVVKRGRLNVSSTALCDKGRLDINSKVRMENVVVEPIGDPSQTILFELPTTYVIQFLQDENGAINFDFKIDGDIKKPDFHFGSEVERAMRQAMMRRVADGVQRLLEQPQRAGEQIEKIGRILGNGAAEKTKQIREKLEEIFGK